MAEPIDPRVDIGHVHLKVADLDRASDHGVSEALYLRDPDGNGVELYWDRAKSQWPRAADGSVEMTTRRLDLDALLEEGCRTAPASGLAPLSAVTRARFADLRTSLLSLHKALLDDAKVAYEMDRGRIPSTGALLQLVIGDPWFAWLQQLSGLIVRSDEMTATEAKATDADARALFEQVDRLLVPSETGADFARRYFEALQRQPAVVLAHGEVKRVLKSPSA